MQLGSKKTLPINWTLNFFNYHLGYSISMVHRPDKDTSGVLIFAKNKNPTVELAKSFACRKFQKEYISYNLGVSKIKSDILKSTHHQNLDIISIIEYQVLKHQIQVFVKYYDAQ